MKTVPIGGGTPTVLAALPAPTWVPAWPSTRRRVYWTESTGSTTGAVKKVLESGGAVTVIGTAAGQSNDVALDSTYA